MTSRSDFAEIAARAAAWADDVRACLILSADGLTLGAFPAEQEAAARDVWSRLAGTGHPARGFLEFGTETWACVRRGGYSGVLIASVGARPGVLLDALDRALREAQGEATETPRAPEPPARRARPDVPRETKRIEHVLATRTEAPVTIPDSDAAGPQADAAGVPEPVAVAAAGEEGPLPLEIDPVELSREFGALLDRDRER
ncbi:MAG TPA: hypothetical protein VEO00_11185 [Actinomycetota bacterium]|nr:hypothetical protein [Actinomycetota bacterium]